jgi:CDP-paratose 2-epimerase
MTKYALVTGSCGLVGSESVNFLIKKKFTVFGIDNNERKFFFGNDGDTSWIKKKLLKKKLYKHFTIDISNYKRTEKIFKKIGPKIKLIIHCAAQPSHDWAKKNLRKDFTVNAVGTLNILDLSIKYSKKSVFIHLSTNKVYGDNPNNIKLLENKLRFYPKNYEHRRGFDERLSTDSCVHSFFGVSKTYADYLAQEFGKNFGLKIGIFRAGCITGPNHSGSKLHGFLSYLVKSCIKKKYYNIIGYKGKQVRDNIHSQDLLNCFWEFYKKPKKGVVYNIGGGSFSNCSILECIKYIEKKTKIKIKLKIKKKQRMGDHKWYISNLKKFKKDYPHWRQKYNTKKILDELIASNISY